MLYERYASCVCVITSINDVFFGLVLVVLQCGYLSKLGGPLKTWKKRWFVLREGRLHYYKSEVDVLRRKVKGEVVLDEAARVQRTNEG